MTDSDKATETFTNGRQEVGAGATLSNNKKMSDANLEINILLQQPSRTYPPKTLEHKIFSVIQILSLASAGACLGCMVVELITVAIWGRTTDFTLADALREFGFKLPRSSWIGIENTIEWCVSQSLMINLGFVCAALHLFCKLVHLRRPKQRIWVGRLVEIRRAFIGGPEQDRVCRLEPKIMSEAYIERAYVNLDNKMRGSDRADKKAP